MANLRAGMVGIGSMGKNHVRNLRAIDGVDLVAVSYTHLTLPTISSV